MIHVVSYADSRMTISVKKCLASALALGAARVYNYTTFDIDANFCAANASILMHSRGAGYWLWKPYVLKKVMQLAVKGDVVIYADAGLVFMQQLSEIIRRMDQDIFLFGNTHMHGKWCKIDVLKAMDCNRKEFIEHEQVQASVITAIINPHTIEFVSEWLKWAQIPGMIDDSPSSEPEAPYFIEHRHDQAILTNLALLYGYRFHHWAAQYNRGNGVKYSDHFPQPMFWHHRKRDDEW